MPVPGLDDPIPRSKFLKLHQLLRDAIHCRSSGRRVPSWSSARAAHHRRSSSSTRCSLPQSWIAKLMIPAALDAFGRIAYPGANREVDSSTHLPARLLPVTDNVIELVYQTEYWMSFICKGALALYSVAIFTVTHTRKKMKNSAAIRAILTRFLRGSVSGPQNQGPRAAMYAAETSLRLRIRITWGG